MSDYTNFDLELLLNTEEDVSIYVLDAKQRYVYFNKIHAREMDKLFQAKVKVGLNKTSLLPKLYQEDFKKLYARGLDSGPIKHVFSFNDEYYEFAMNPIIVEEELLLIIRVRKVTDEIRINQELEKYRAKLEDLIKDRTETIANQRDFFQKVIDGDDNLIYVVDHKGECQLINSALMQSLGESLDEIKRQGLNHLIKNKSLDDIDRKEDLMIFESGKEVHDIRRMRLDQEVHWLSVKKKRISINHEYHILCTMTRITDLMKARDELQVSNDKLNDTINDLKEMQLRLVTTEKIASILLLTSGFMHEISNPINYVSGNVQPLRNDIEDLIKWLEKSGYPEQNEEIRSEVEVVKSEVDILLDGIEEGASRVKTLVQNLKKLSYSQSENESSCDVHGILTGVLTMLSLVVEQKKVLIDKNLQAEGHHLTANANYLNQVFINVLDYVISRMEDQEELQIKTSDSDDTLIIEIIDVNRPILDNEIDRMIAPFDKIASDNRVGLAVSYRIVTKMNGTISTKSNQEKTHFIISLPIYHPDSPA
jgi:PAS domain S-box-containing protein